jgi:hypothetical protein
VLLLITGSIDGTSDFIVEELGEKVFRFNYDLFNEYELEFSPNFWEIKNPTGRTINSNTVASVFWWKAFSYYLTDQEAFIVEEVKYIFREIYHHCRLRGLTRGVPHDYHNHMGKMNILSIASRYFATPQTLATFRLAGVDKLGTCPVVAKSFTSGLTTTNKALFTTAVETKALHPDFPWYLQEQIDSPADVTVFICGQDLFAFERTRTDLKGLDWRAEQTFDVDVEEWKPIILSHDECKSAGALCKDLGVDWGRMDLMRRDEQLIFLEYNANGQWVFLDYQQKYGLLRSVVKYLTD